MVSERRLEIRIDQDLRDKLRELAEERGVPVSEVVRQSIMEAYEAVQRRRRLEAVGRIARLEVEDVPEPEELSRQLNSTYDPNLPGH